MSTTEQSATSDTGRDGHHPPHQHQITIYVNGRPFTTTQHTVTGREIKALAAVPLDYELFVVRDGHSVPVGNDETVHLHEHEHFRAIPSGTFGGARRAAADAR